MMQTYEGFRTRVSLSLEEQRLDVRPGQHAFIALNRARPDIANQIRGRYRVDPFYIDENLPEFWAAVEKLWGSDVS